MSEEIKQELCPKCMTVLSDSTVCPNCGMDTASYHPEKHHLPPRTILNGKYLVGCVLGEGGFGITYVGWDLLLHTMVAIKEYFPIGIVARDNTVTNVVSVFSGKSEQYFQHDREKFLTEARMLAKFDGMPGIVGVKNFFKENGTAYIVMEYIQGITLAQFVEKNGGKLFFGRVMDLLDMPMQALSKMHQQKAYHRDISPENIMVAEDGSVKLIDFGSSRTDTDSKTTHLKVRNGFSPIELYTMSEKEGPFSDIYSLSATIYRCVTGIEPMPATSRVSDDQLVPPIKAGARGMTPQQETALLQGMAVKPQERCQRVEDLHQALTEDAPKSKGKIKPLWIAAASLLLALVVVLVILFTNKTVETPPPVTATPISAEDALDSEVPFSMCPELEASLRVALNVPEGAQIADYAQTVSVYVSPGGAIAHLAPNDPEALALEESKVFAGVNRQDFIEAEAGSYHRPIVVLSAKKLHNIRVSLEAANVDVRDLTFRNLVIEDLSPLQGLERIYDGFYASNCALPEDLSPLGSLHQSNPEEGIGLYEIVLHGDLSHVKDLSWLSNHKSLRLLQFFHSANNRVGCAFENIECEGWQIDLSPVASLKDLKYLDLWNLNLRDVSALRDLPIEMERINLSYNQIEDFSPVEDHTGYLVSDEQHPDEQAVSTSFHIPADADPQIPFSLCPELTFSLTASNYAFPEDAPRWDRKLTLYLSPDGAVVLPGDGAEVDCGVQEDNWNLEDIGSFGYVRPTEVLNADRLRNIILTLKTMDANIAKLVVRNLIIEDLSPLAVDGYFLSHIVFSNCVLPEDLSPLGQVNINDEIEQNKGFYNITITGDLSGIRDLSWLTTSRGVMTSVNLMHTANHISQPFIAENIECEGWKIDLKPLTELQSLRYLTLSNMNLRDISALEGLHDEMEWIDIGRNGIRDLTPLERFGDIVYGKDWQ